MSDKDQTVRVLTQATEIVKRHLSDQEKDNSELVKDLDFRRNLYTELKKSEVFWRGEARRQGRVAHVSNMLMIFVSIMALASLGMNILMCQ